MGGTSSQQAQQQATTTRNPWDPAIPFVSGIAQQGTGLLSNTGLNPAENTAFDTLRANAQQGNPYSPSIATYAQNLLGGGGASAQAPMLQSAFNTYQQQLGPYASGGMIGANNPYVNNLVDTLGTDISGRINAQYAGAGRDLSGNNALAVARGISQGVAPTLLNQYNQDIQNTLGAAASAYGAANTTGGLLSNLNQTGLGNQGAGVSAADAALAARDSAAQQQLAIEAARRGVPVQNLAQLAQIGVPLAGLGGSGTSTGTASGTQTMSPVQQAQGWANVFGKLFPAGL